MTEVRGTTDEKVVVPPMLPAAEAWSVTGDPPAERTYAHQGATTDLMLAAVPKLRGFAISLCGDPDRADDLVQQTLLHALSGIHSFQPGTNMNAWLFTILRNQFRSEHRKRRREVEDVDGRYEASLTSAPAQDSRQAFAEFHSALAQLTADQREALVLVGAAGFSYDEAAEICAIAIGTVKSRVHRARLRLAELLRFEPNT